jgi:phosphatidate phosphatase APP1
MEFRTLSYFIDDRQIPTILLNLKTSVEWDLECIDFYFRQGAMRRNNALLQRIATWPELKSSVL